MKTLPAVTAHVEEPDGFAQLSRKGTPHMLRDISVRASQYIRQKKERKFGMRPHPHHSVQLCHNSRLAQTDARRQTGRLAKEKVADYIKRSTTLESKSEDAAPTFAATTLSRQGEG